MSEKNELDTNLDPEVEKIRDQIILKIGDKTLDEVNQIIKKLLMENMDETMRLAALAARVKIIRSKISLLYDNKIEINKPKSKQPVKQMSNEKPNVREEKWVRMKMLESGEVNGKQIDKNVILDVKEEDSKILVDAKKAEIVIEKTETTVKPDLTKKADVDHEKKESVKTDNKGEIEENKSDNKKMNNNESGKSPSDSEQNIEDKNQKNLLDKHAKKEKDNDTEGSLEKDQKGKNIENNSKLDSKESKLDEKEAAEPAATAASSSEEKPAEESKAADKPVESAAATSSEEKLAEETNAKNKD